jgi:hypothetical protein
MARAMYPTPSGITYTEMSILRSIHQHLRVDLRLVPSHQCEPTSNEKRPQIVSSAGRFNMLLHSGQGGN